MKFLEWHQDSADGSIPTKANYVDMILQSKSLVTITQIAKDYGMSGRKLNKILKELKIQYKVGGQWVLYSKYQNGGYVHSRTITSYMSMLLYRLLI